MGVTYTGMYEPVKQIAEALDAIQAKTGLDIAIHVDAASGGMIAPFLQPDLEWDFRLERVHSISTSGHKYGLVYPGLGWVIWRSADLLPKDLIFKVSYLGGDMPTFALNFSRPASQVLLQYYLFLRLGRDGYTQVQQASQDVAKYLAAGVAKLGPFDLWNDGSDIPVFAWRLKDDHAKNWSLYHLSDRLRTEGWLVPAYPMPADLQEITVQRIVVRNGMSMDLADKFLVDMAKQTDYLDRLESPMPIEAQPAFHH
jgi:glutamate decarboxylase